MPERAHVAVVGGGLAGITTALALVDAGVRVSVFEQRSHLGGATWSFERNGRSFDNGQHVYLRCCTAYRRLLDRLGTAEKAPLQEKLSIPVLSPRPGGDPAVSVISRTALPSPLHLAPALLTYRHLGLADRARLRYALQGILAASALDPAYDAETFATFLRRHHQSDLAIERLWDLITLPTTNLRSEEVSAAVALKVFRTGLFDEADAADIGWSRVPLAELHGEPAQRILEKVGAAVSFRSKVEGFETSNEAGVRRVSALRVAGERVEVDAVVLAVPHLQAADLAPAGAIDEQERLGELGSSPIIDVHVVYEDKVTDYVIAAGVGTPVQYVFDRSDAAGLEMGRGQCLAVSVSGADREHGERPEVLIERYTAALSDLFPRARTTKVLDAVVSREHHATFRAKPGQSALRPGATTRVANLLLAGAWTDTGWPATMEGAVRSGTEAAWQVRRVLGERDVLRAGELAVTR